MSLFDRRRVLGLMAASPLAACGFEPVYRDATEAADLYGQIAIKPVSGRYAFELREELQHLLGTPVSDPRYAMSLSLRITSAGIAISDTQGTTRNNLTGVATFSITPSAGGAIVYTDSVSHFTAYSSNAETYPTRIASQGARSKLARSLAHEVERRIALTAPDWHS